MTSTGTLRTWFAGYECEKMGRNPQVILLGKRVPVNPLTIDAWLAFSSVATNTGFVAQVVQTYNCRPITGGSGLSLHAFGIAVDIDPTLNPYIKTRSFDWKRTTFTPVQVKALLDIKTNNGKKVFQWGGYYVSVKDYMHWEVQCSPSDLKTGIDPSTLVGEYEQEEVLKFQDKGSGVKVFQRALLVWNPKILPKFGADGDYGNEMVEAVKQYQTSAGLPASGQIDGITASLLTRYVSVGSTAAPTPTVDGVPRSDLVKALQEAIRTLGG